MEVAPIAGVKRPLPTSHNTGRRHVRRNLKHVQARPKMIEPAPQDPAFIQGQLLRSITAALAVAGFDSVKPTALEMFRSNVEEYILDFLHSVRTSMHTSRRTTSTAQDFAYALASRRNTSSASLLRPQLQFQVPEGVSYPPIAEPDEEAAGPPDFSALLAPLVDNASPAYVPQHFPKLPPKHAWKYTDVYPERERDARKMREKATEEGVMAEQALRKLAAAAKTGAMKLEKKRLNTLHGPGRRVQNASRGRKRGVREMKGGQQAEEMFGEMMKEVAGKLDQDEGQVMDLGVEGTIDLRQQGVDVGMPDGVLVNAETGSWRRGGRRGLRL